MSNKMFIVCSQPFNFQRRFFIVSNCKNLKKILIKTLTQMLDCILFILTDLNSSTRIYKKTDYIFKSPTLPAEE